MRKKVTLLSVCILSIVVLTCALVACSGKSDYLAKVDSYNFMTNKVSTALSQTTVAKIVRDHYADTTSGKTKKVAILGFDGARIEAMDSIFYAGADNSGDNSKAKYSAMNTLVDNGGKAYVSYCGGEKGKDTEQATSTAPGWASMLTGEWGIVNGVVDNGMIKNMDSKTVLLAAAENGARTSFSASWDEHFEKTYSLEIDYLARNADIDMKYNNFTDDDKMQDYLLKAVTEGSAEERDFVFCIYERPDNNGHGSGYNKSNPHYINSVRNSDMLAYEVLQQIYDRPSYDNEDWLIVMSTDHGGNENRGHGKQSAEEKIIYIVSNKTISESYYSKNFDGYKLK